MGKRQLASAASSYDVDFFQWTQETAEMIRQRRLDEADLEHVAEEIEDMGKRDRREVRSRLIVLILHLLKWRHQERLRAKSSWRRTIVEQRRQLNLVLQDSPSLRRLASAEIGTAYAQAVLDASEETGLSHGRFPIECPYSIDQLLDSRYLPD